MINPRHDVDKEIMKKRKQDLINKDKERENRNWINHTYKQGYKVFLKNLWKTNFNQDSYIGPDVITAFRNNGTIRTRKGRVADIFNNWDLTPYKELATVHHGAVRYTKL